MLRTKGNHVSPSARRAARSGVALPMGLGLLATTCFATIFVLNRTMSVAGGSWMWSASLRYRD